MIHVNDRVAELWTELEPALRAFFQRHARHGSDPDDLLQECFLRVAAGIGRVEDHARLGGWVQAIARHIATDTLRDVPVLRADEATLQVPAAAAEERLDDVIGGWIRNRIEDMQSDDGEMLRAFELEGVPQAEIAARFGLSLTAVKSRIRHARMEIRKDILACCTIDFDRRGRVLDWQCRIESNCNSKDLCDNRD